MWKVILGILLVAKGASSATVTGLDYIAGSKNGGTILRIGGTGFAQNPLDNEGGNRVYFKSSSQKYECDIEKDGTDETTITCQTRAMAYGAYVVRVEVDGVPIPDDLHCSTNPSACSFSVYFWSTPLLYTLWPLTGTPGTQMTLNGRLFTNKTRSSQAVAANGNTATIRRVWIGGKKCSLYKDTDELYGVELGHNEEGDYYTNWGTIKCLHSGNYCASQNASFIVDGAYGRSLSDPNVLKVASDYRLYNYQTYAVIDSVTPITGSTHGGTLITVNGDYFDDSSIQVKVGGEKCDVLHREDAFFTCETSPQGNTFFDAFPGSRGVLVEIYAGLDDKTAIDNTAYEDYTGTGTKSQYQTDRSEIVFTATEAPVVIRLRGFFIPAKDGTYSFSATGNSDVYVSTDQTMANKVSSPEEVTLTSGSHYYFEVVHTEPTVNVNFRFVVYLQETDYTSNQTVMAKEENQTIATSSPDINEIQRITLNNWEQNPTPANEIIELCISCLAGSTCQSIEEYAFTLNGISTGTLLSSFDAFPVQFWIQQLPGLGGDTVQVVKSDDPGTCISHYVITVQSTRGSLLLEANPVDPTRVSAVLSVTTASKTSLSSFTLAVGGIPSGHVTVGNTGSLATAVKSIFGTSCPRALESELGAATFFSDFESSADVYGGKITSENSYCGTYSLKNPTNVDFQITVDNPRNLDDSLQVCFAYKGKLSGVRKFDYQYITATSSDFFDTYEETFTEDEATEWKHACYGVLDFIQDTATSGFGHQITSFSMAFALSDSDFFVDNIFLGDVYIGAKDLETLRGMRRLPLHDTLRLEDVTVTQDGDNYDIEMIPLDCGTGLPLLEIAYATKNAEGAYTDAEWTSSSITVQRTQSAAPPIGGTFGVTLPADGTAYGGSLSDIPWNIEAAELEARIEGLNGVSDVYVTRSGTCRGYTWAVNFINPAGRQKQLTATGGNFENSDATITTVGVTNGGLYLDPIPGDWLRIANKEPNVEVIINKVPSKCQGQCAFTQDDSATPTVTDAMISGSTATITGTGISATVEDSIVQIGGVVCTVTSASETTIECTIGESPAGTQLLVVNVKDKGNTNAVEVQVPFAVTGISPSTGSAQGGTTVTLTGTGFSPEVSVQIGDSPCSIKASGYSSITCVTGPSADGLGTVVATAGTATSGSDVTYTFEASAATVTSLSTTTFTVLGGTLTITGTEFGAESSDNSVYFGAESVSITTWSETEITITAPPLDSGTYALRVHIHPTGDADASGYNEIDYVLRVDSVTPAQSSFIGGIDITITGDGFDEGTKVNVGESECLIKEHTPTSISCTMGNCGTTHNVDNTGTSALGTGYAWNPEKLTIYVGDQVSWSWSELDGVSGAAYQVFTTESASSLTYNENGFSSGSQTFSGSYTYRFNVPGTYYIGGVANSALDIFMRGVITVQDATDVTTDITVDVGDYTATLANGISCQASLTPTITSITPSRGTSETLITISGTGLSNTLQETKVFVGDAACTVEETTAAVVTCKVGTETEMTVGLYQEVRVNVGGKGDSRSDINSLADRYFALEPFVSSVTPSTGSVKGKTTITITGGGLSSATEVMIQGIVCSIISKSYTEIQCDTGESVAGLYDVQVLVLENSLSMQASCSAVCKFEYRAEDTPMLTGVDPTAVSGATVITITGEGFQGDATTTVMIGSTPCTEPTVTDTSISCSVTDLPVGVHTVEVVVKGKGAADSGAISFTVTSNAVITGISPSVGSVEGGTEITITGNGFVDGETTLTIGGIEVATDTITSSSIVFTTPGEPAGTVDVVITSSGVTYDHQTYEYSEANTPAVTNISPASGEQGDTITLSVSSLGDGNPRVALGGVTCTVVTAADGNIECTLGIRYGGNADIVVTIPSLGLARVNSGVAFSYTFSVTSVSPTAGSLGGGQELTVTGNGMDPNATITICDQECEKTQAMRTPTTITCLTPPSTQAQACSVTVMNTDVDILSLDAVYTYDSSLTPIVTSVSPASGGTGGGTTLTIEGSNLSGATSVTIDGVECTVDSKTETQIVCTTGQHSGTIETKVQVHFGTNGIAPTDNTGFHYVDKWSSVFTWGGVSLPEEGDFVVIEKGQTVLFDTTSAKLSMLLIKGGSLIFEEMEGEEVHLNAENILITEGGLLQIGTEEQPYMTRAKITMHGHLRSPEFPIYGAKTLGVREGRLELHGKQIDNTWTVLDETANAGETQITLQVPVTWSVGDKIVIASTGLRHSQGENEDRIIQSISDDGRIITLDQALNFKHLGITEEYTNEDGKTVSFDYRGEVGLLSRNIVFEGSDAIEWHDEIEACPDGFDTGMFTTQTCFQGRFGEEVGSDEFGASIMIHSPTPTTDPDNPVAEAHIEYVELTYVGQAFRLGRYPIHWHLMGDMTNSYVRGCAFHKSFNRAVSIHGTHNLLVERNVIYNIMGGAFFIEDGIETGNTIQYNLAVFVRQSTSLLNDDITPAAYWITNPNNIIQHNHAAGGTHFGFWYRMHQHPDGPSFDSSICQQKVELGTFQNNTVHSQGWFGLWIFQTYTPMEGGGCGSSVPMAAKFYSLTAWHCEKGAEWVEGGAIQFHNFKLSSNEICGIDIKLISGTDWDKGDRGALIKDNVIIGHSNAMEYDYSSTSGIILPFASKLWIDGVDFFNLDASGHTALSVTSISGTCTWKCGGFYYLVENMKFTNTPTRVRWHWEHEGIIYDLDGSFSGREAGTKVVPYSAIYEDGRGECEKNSDAMFGGGSPIASAVCQPHVRFHRFAFNHIHPTSLEFKDVTVSNAYGNSTSLYLKKRMTHKEGWMFVLRGHETFNLEFANGAEQFTNLSFTSTFYDFLDGDYLIMRQVLTQKPDRASLVDGETLQVGNTTAITSASLNREWHYDENTGEFKFLVGRPTSSKKKRSTITSNEVQDYVVNPNIYRCFYRDCVRKIIEGSQGTLPEIDDQPDDAITVSELTMEGNCMEITGDTDDDRIVTIPDECSIVWAIPNAVVRVLYIRTQGNLFFTEDTAVTLTATHIVSEGRLIAGWAHNNPHKNNLHIILRGNHQTEDFETETGTRVPPKALACFGTCDIHGKTVDTTWTSLEQTANAGSQTLVLQKEVSWKAGDEIVIAPSGFNAWQTEKSVISAVNGNTLTLTQPLTHTHKALTASYGIWNIDVSAEVGLLTKSIKIESEDTSDLLEESFGAFALVSTTGEYAALGRFSNVEFHHSGQEGFYDASNPRHSVTFLNAARNGEVIACAFHDGFSAAVGTYGTDAANIANNVIHHTVNDGVVIKGTGHTLHSNLVLLNIFRGSYQDRFETTNFDYTAAVNIESAQSLAMTSNVVAGAERAAYKIAGQPCDTSADMIWSNNVAKASLVGTFQWTSVEGTGGCSLVSGFRIYKAWDFGMYQQVSDNVQVQDCALVDCTVGYVPIIYGPAALSHEAENKYATISNSLVVGRSDVEDCTTDMEEDTDKSLIIRRIAGKNKKAPSTPSGGRTGILLPLFASSKNGATFKSLIINMNYPAIYGKLEVTDVTAAKFGDACNGLTDRLFYTNPQNEDIFHPTHVKRLQTVDVSEKGYLFIDRPSTSKINPSDCVDMSCDAMRTVLIRLEDDSLFGNGYLFAEAEWQWDEETVYGLGDYRIPKPMLSTPNGERIPISTLAPNGKGIPRTDACQLESNYQAYKCTGSSTLDYRMLIIESLDADTETRRLSPVALLTNGYINLYNGPQDHGWCAGYTCQKRISTFYTIVPANSHTDIYFTSTPPQNFRLHLINGQPEDKLTVGIWIPNPQKLDVYDADGTYIQPLNTETDGAGKTQLKEPPATDPDLYKPTIASNNGDNYLDFGSRVLYLTVNSVVTINTTDAIIVTFGFPAQSIDEFFGENIVNNIAAFLRISPDKIRRVSVVSESSSRRKRSTGTETVSIEIAGTTPEETNSFGNTLRTAYQTGSLEVEGVKPTSMEETLSDTEQTITDRDAALTSGEDVTNVRVVTQPTKILLKTLPAGEEKSSLTTMPRVHLLDINDALVVTDVTWTVKVELDISHASAHADAVLTGTTTISFTNGVAEFSDLVISHSGTYTLVFTPSDSASAIPGVTSDAFTLSERTVGARIEHLEDSGLTTAGSDLNFELQLTDGSGNNLQDVPFKGLTYKIEVSLESFGESATLAGTTSFDFDSAGELSMTGLSLSGTTNYHIYNLKFRLFTDPASNYDYAVGIEEIQIYPTEEADYLHHDTSNAVDIVLTFRNDYDEILGSNAPQTIQTAYHNDLASRYPQVYFSQFIMSKTQDGNLRFTSSATSNTKSAVDSFTEDFSISGVLQYSRQVITLDTSCGISVSGICSGETTITTTVAITTTSTTNSTASPVGDDNSTIIIFATLGACVFVSLTILIAVYVLKRYQGSKVGVLQCVDSSPMTSRAASSSLDSIQPYVWGRGTPDADVHGRMTPVTA